MRFLAIVLLLLTAGMARAQVQEPALTDAEVEILRDKAPVPAERVQAFAEFLDGRTKAIDKLLAGRRKPGREEDLHDLMEEFSSIANDLEDNLEEYGKRHKDVRKSLPKLLAATERWATALRSPADNEAYNVSRKLALEAVADVKQTATELVTEQKGYFLAHPPPKDDPRGNPGEFRGPPL